MAKKGNDLKLRLYELFEQHIKKNKGQPLFASDIEDEKKREDWKKNQLEQWNARHDILKRLVKLDDRKKEEITDDDFIDRREYHIFHLLELRQRWLRPEGVSFLKAIIGQLEILTLCYLRRRRKSHPGLNFSSVTFNDEKFTNFYYVHKTKERKYRDLRWANLKKTKLQGADLCNANLQGANLGDTNLQGAILRDADLQGAVLSKANLQGADLSIANIQGAILKGVNLQRAGLPNANLQRAHLEEAKLQGAHLEKAKLQRAHLQEAELQWADLSSAKLQGAFLYEANLQGVNLDHAVIAGSALRRVDTGTGDAEREIDNRSADFTHVEYTREWRGPKYIIPIPIIAWLIHFMKKKLAWRKWKGKKEEKYEIDIEDYPEPKKWYAGRPTTFFGVDTSRMDGSKNPGLKRYIEDEQYIEDFKKNHPVIYWFWAMSSDCGRCLSLWAFWSLLIAGIFGFAFADYPYPDWMPRDCWVEDFLCGINPEVTIDYTAETTKKGESILREKSWFTPYYYSTVTFTTLGFGDVKPRNLAAEMWLTVEVVLGYFFLGGLVAILASKLARRA